MQKFDALAFVGDGIYKRQTAEDLLAQMDANGVERALIAPPEEQVTVDNAAGNERISQICRRWPDRFWGYAVSNPWYGAAACDTLRRALDDGLRAVYFDSSVQGFTISDPLVDPLMAVCAAYDVPVYFHTGTPAFALPFQLHFLAKRFPTVRFLMGHAGANDFSADALPALRGVDNLWLESSMNLTVSMMGLLQQAPDRVVFGSASPRSDLRYELQRLYSAEADAKSMQKALAGNLLTVLGGRL